MTFFYTIQNMDKLNNDTLLKIMAEMTISHNKAITETTRRINELEIKSEAYERLLIDSNITDKIYGTARCYSCDECFVNYQLDLGVRMKLGIYIDDDEEVESNFHKCKDCKRIFCYECTEWNIRCYECKINFQSDK